MFSHYEHLGVWGSFQPVNRSSFLPLLFFATLLATSGQGKSSSFSSVVKSKPSSYERKIGEWAFQLGKHLNPKLLSVTQ